MRPVDCTKQTKLGSLSPLLLFPIRDLPEGFKKEILKSAGKDHPISEVINDLFICPDHFGHLKNANLELSLRSDAVFNFSLEYLVEAIDSGKSKFRLGRKSLKNLPFLPHLIDRAKSQPSFVTPNPVNIETLNLVASAMSGNMLTDDHFIQTPQPLTR